MSVGFRDSMTGGNRQTRLRGALLIYIGENGVVVTAHDAQMPDDGQRPELVSGWPVHRDQVDLFARALLGHAPVRTVLPPEVLVADGLRTVWWTPSRRRRIWFSAKDNPHLQHVSRQEVTHPPLLWVADPGCLYLHALPSDERPTVDTPIYQAPYLNTYADGWVCAGAVKWPESIQPDAIPAWEQTFHDSEGTLVWAAELTRYPGGHAALWNAMLNAESFPAETLVPSGMTVLDAINRTGKPKGLMDRQPREQIVAPEGVAA